MLITLGFVLFLVVGTIGLTLLAAGGAHGSARPPMQRLSGFVDAQFKRTASAVDTLSRTRDDAPTGLTTVDPRTEAYLLFGLGLLGVAGAFVFGVILLTL